MVAAIGTASSPGLVPATEAVDAGPALVATLDPPSASTPSAPSARANNLPGAVCDAVAVDYQVADDPRSLRRDDFSVLRQLPTRWSDEDAYGHVNNVVHYLMFDTAINGWLIEASGTDVRRLPAIGVVAETSCRYYSELRFPEVVTAGIRLDRLGRRSVAYRVALFPQRGPVPAAVGRFVHVYVDRGSRQPVAVPDEVLGALQLLARDHD